TPRRQPMQQRQYRVKLDRKPAIGGGDEQAFAGDAPSLAKEPGLALAIADMLEHGARMDVIERVVGKRQLPTVGANEAHPRINLRQKRGIVETDGGHPMLVAVPGLKVVRVIIAAVAGDADIEDLVRRTGTGERDEGLEHLAPLMPRNTSRQAVRGGNIVLSVDSEPVAPTARRITVAIVQAQGSRLRRGGR